MMRYSRLIKTFIETLRSEETKQNSLVQTLSNSIHSREMDLASKERELKDKEGLEKEKEEAQTAIKGFEVQLRVSPSFILARESTDDEVRLRI
jgi:DNA repair protein RAD50